MKALITYRERSFNLCSKLYYLGKFQSELHLLVVRHEGYLVLGEVHVVVDSAALHCNEQFTNEGLWDYTADNLSLQLETSSKYLFETMALPRGLQTGLDVAGCQIVFRFIFVVIIFIALPPPMSTTTEIHDSMTIVSR